MMKINWKVRLRQKQFLVGMFAAILLFTQTVGSLLGYELSFGETATEIFNSVMGLLVLLGVIVDPTTKGVNDSEQAKEYREPK